MTAIEWTDATWNPVTGCSKVSPGCDHCYAETLSLRFGWSRKPWSVENAAENVVLHPERLEKPLSWREPRMVFVNSMSDLFHEQVPDDYIADVFTAMEVADRHTFQVLTKRPDRMAEWTQEHRPEPLPNVWLGTSIESWRFNYRADQLRRVVAAVRFLSAEPLLDTLYPPEKPERALNLDGIRWVIVGGESGPHFRPMNPDWAREIRDACLDGVVPGDACDHCRLDRRSSRDEGHWAPCRRAAFFFKQWGGRTPKSGGRELDGREWSEYPS